MKRRARPNSLNVAYYDLVKLVQEFKQRICERLQLSEFIRYYRIRGKTNLAKIDENIINKAKREVLIKTMQKMSKSQFLNQQLRQWGNYVV